MTAEQIIEIPLAQLHDSPFQPRIDYTGIDELAANIAAEGRIHQPLVVRLRGADGDGFEIVFGHRRRRAAERAGLATAPCVLRTMSDAEVRSAQMAENVQREAMKALEEAAGYKAMIDEDGLTANEVATAIGKSLSHVYGRLRLLDLVPEVRDALLTGEIQSEVALLIARVGGEKLQHKALSYIRGKYYELDDGGVKSFRAIRALLNERFTLGLKDALFDPTDATLLPDAGACGPCPKRSANAPEFDDVAAATEKNQHSGGRHRHGLANFGADVCTDPDCFDAKKRAHLKRKAEQLQAQGKTVVDGARARQVIGADGTVKGAYVALAEVKDALKKAGAKPETVLIQNPRDGKTVQAVKREDLQAVGVKLKEPAPGRSPRDNEAERRRREEEWRAAEAKAEKETAYRTRVLQAVRAAMASTERSAFDMQLLAHHVLESVGWHTRQHLLELHGLKSYDALRNKAEQLDAQACALLMLDCALLPCLEVHPNSSRDATPLMAAAQHYGVDAKALRADPQTSASPASPPDTAARGKKSAAAGAAKKPKAKKAAAGAARKVKDKAGSAGQVDWVGREARG